MSALTYGIILSPIIMSRIFSVPPQSAYRQFHSTKTAVTRIYNDLLSAADSGQLTVLYLLDLTYAFDTVDHELLLLRLERQFGLCGIVLQQFQSYLSGRSFLVLYGGSVTSIVYTVCSVPQLGQSTAVYSLRR